MERDRRRWGEGGSSLSANAMKFKTVPPSLYPAQTRTRRAQRTDTHRKKQMHEKGTYTYPNLDRHFHSSTYTQHSKGTHGYSRELIAFPANLHEYWLETKVRTINQI